MTRAWAQALKPEWTVSITGAPRAGERAGASLCAEDRQLVEACLRGRRDAFDVIVERHQRRVYQLCYRFVSNHEDASDLAQEVFVRAFRALGGFKGRSAFTTWLYRVAVNVCLNRVSQRTPAVEALADHRLHSPDETPDQAILREERAAQVRAAIARLPPKQRATLILRVYDELRHDEIAEILGASVGAVKANFFHALANLEKLLRESEAVK